MAQPLEASKNLVSAETSIQETAHVAAESGKTATDRYGQCTITIDPKAEAPLRRKIDLYVIPTIALLYLCCFIDRANIGNAKLAGLEEDLHMNPESYDFNALLSVFYVAYIVFEIPSQIACKLIGPGWYIPTITLGFGISSFGTAFVRDQASASGVRFLLGVFEAGMFPGIAYYLSRWYRRRELTLRLSLYVVTAPLAGAFGGLLASGILTLDHFGSLHSWRMIFAIEGIITCGVSIIAFFTLTDRPATARWLTQEEKDLAIARVKSERIATKEVLDKIDQRKLLLGIFSPVTLATSFIFLLNSIPVNGLAFFAPTIVATIYPNASVVEQQLRTAPPYVVGAFFTILFPLLSTISDRRLIIMMLSAPFMIVGYIMFLASESNSVRYGATFLITPGAFPFGALANANVSANVVSDTARSGAIGTVVMIGNIGGLIATWSFLPFDAPDYHIGNGLNLAASSTIFLIAIAMWFLMKFDNSRRDNKNVDSELRGLTEKQIENLDWKNPAFRWRP